MKVKVIMAFLIVLLLSACNVQGTNAPNRKTYAIAELQAFFEGHIIIENNTVYSSFAGSIQFADASGKYPDFAESMSQRGERYTAYEVAEGGKYYVFWTKDGTLRETLYIDRLRTEKDFSMVRVGATLEDVQQIDPGVALLVSSSKDPRTHTYLKNGKILEFVYDLSVGGTYIIKEKQLLSEESFRINKEDLPQN